MNPKASAPIVRRPARTGMHSRLEVPVTSCVKATCGNRSAISLSELSMIRCPVRVVHSTGVSSVAPSGMRAYECAISVGKLRVGHVRR